MLVNKIGSPEAWPQAAPNAYSHVVHPAAGPASSLNRAEASAYEEMNGRKLHLQLTHI